MDTYYNPKDLLKFGEIGEGAPELWKKFSEWYGAALEKIQRVVRCCI
jgi:hypothetical protein